MKLPGTRVILFNVAAGLVTIAAVVAVVRSLVRTPELAPCTERYPSGTVFALEQGGVLLTSADLQARLSGKDIGLGDNVQDRPHERCPVPGGARRDAGQGLGRPACPHGRQRRG